MCTTANISMDKNFDKLNTACNFFFLTIVKAELEACENCKEQKNMSHFSTLMKSSPYNKISENPCKYKVQSQLPLERTHIFDSICYSKHTASEIINNKH